MNVYSGSLYTTMNFLSDKALNIPNLLYMRGDFNARNAKQNPSISLYPAADQALEDLVDSYSYVCSILVLYVPTHYSDI